jgi:hypothetical protein
MAQKRAMPSRKPKRRAPAKRPASPKAKSKRSTPWPTIEEFLDSEQGSISLGGIGYNESLGYTAVVSDESNMLVALVRRRGESLHQLLDRLERALGPAIEDQVFVDEINGPD